MSDKWEKFVDPHFEEVVKYLQPMKLLDKFRGEGLITREEYSNLQEVSELKRARTLVNDLLPRKGKDSLDKFCRILLKTPGQEHIVKDIIKYEPSHSEVKKPKVAAFIFKEEHRESIDDEVQSAVCSMCSEFFHIDKNHVYFEFEDNSDKRHRQCFCDLSNKLVVLKVHGVSPDRVTIYRKRLIGCILTFLNKAKRGKVKQCKVKRRQVLFKETFKGCSFIILSVDINSFIDLLCSLGQEERNGAKELGLAVQRAIPGLQKGNLFLGGLPAIELFSEPLQPPFMSFKQLGTICSTLSRKVSVIRPQ